MSGLIAVDGGNSKTDLALVTADGTVLSRVRGPGCSPHALGIAGSLDVLDALLHAARDQAGLTDDDATAAEVAAFYLAGLDEPHEEVEYAAAVADTGWAARVLATNDTFAVLRAGTPRDWGVAVVCGAGINACAVDPSGRHGRYQALGDLSGDWGGGVDVGVAALGAAVRGNDGRGPFTSLSSTVPTRMGLGSAEEVADAVHKERLARAALATLAPDVLAASRAGDTAAQGIVDRLSNEVVAMSTALLARLDLVDAGADVVLGGGLLQSGDRRLLDGVTAGIHAVAPSANVRPLAAPPILGAVRAGLVALGADESALGRAETALSPAGVTR